MNIHEIVPALPYSEQIVLFYSYKGGVGRTMALANVASLLSREHSEGKGGDTRILCVDMDLEAPSLHAFLPPEDPDHPMRGFLGLIKDTFEPSADQAQLAGRFTEALGPDPNTYAYRVAETEHLFVMPAGKLPAGDRQEALETFSRAVSSARDPDIAPNTRKKIPLLAALHSTFRELFTYVLIDSRTGLADEGFATTAGLADLMVPVFRPNRTQLLGIQDALARFLYERQVKASDPAVPAIPVLSPRPAYSDKRIFDFRDLAVKEVFKWLDTSKSTVGDAQDNYRPPSQKLLELPFDAAFEIGENLLVPLDSTVKVDDETGPLFLAYKDLTKQIRTWNASNDPGGAKYLELEHYHNNQKWDAFKYLLARIANAPDDPLHWVDVPAGYSELLSSHREARQTFWAFCQAFSSESVSGIGRFFADLWLSQFYANAGLGFQREKIGSAWQQAKQLGRPMVLQAAIQSLARFFANHPEEPDIEQAPSGLNAMELCGLQKLLESKSRSGLANVLDLLEEYYSATRSSSEDLIQAILDQFWVLGRAKDRSILADHLGDTYKVSMRFEEAMRAYKGALLFRDQSKHAIGDFLHLATRISRPEFAAEQIPRLLHVRHEQIVSELLLMARVGSSPDEVRQKLKQVPGLKRGAWFLCYSLACHGQFEEAADVMQEHINKTPTPDTNDLVLCQVIEWCARRREFQKAEADYFLGMAKGDDDPLGATHVLGALAACPDRLMDLARTKPDERLWSLHRFGWLVFAYPSSPNGEEILREITETIDQNPLLAAYVRTHENFPLLRLILSKHTDVAVPSVVRDRFVTVLDMIEKADVELLSDIVPMDFPDAVDDGDPHLDEIHQRWVTKLERAKADPAVAGVVDEILSSEDGDSP